MRRIDLAVCGIAKESVARAIGSFRGFRQKVHAIDLGQRFDVIAHCIAFRKLFNFMNQVLPSKPSDSISFMLNSDDDALIELADALAMRDRGLLPSLDLNGVGTALPN